MTRRLLAALLLVLATTTAADARDRSQVRAFRKANPCPSTGKTTGPCPGWVVDHAWPLCAGGADDPSNMQWEQYLESLRKDRVEIALCRCRAKK
jgi:hypothetical protein